MKTGSVALGAMVAAIGVAWLLEATDTVELDTGVWVGILLVAVGLAVIAAPPGGARGLLIALGILIAIGGAALTASNVDLSAGIGEEREQPLTPDDLEDPYELGIGELRLDLTGLALDGDTTVRAEIGIGELRVTVPDDAAVSVDASLNVGDIQFLDQHESGVDVDLEDADEGGGGDELRLELEGGIGAIKVLRASQTTD
ncbi:MAG: LiaF domain-containing protein [Pseudomonadota bacterium]